MLEMEARWEGGLPNLQNQLHKNRVPLAEERVKDAHLKSDTKLGVSLFWRMSVRFAFVYRIFPMKPKVKKNKTFFF